MNFRINFKALSIVMMLVLVFFTTQALSSEITITGTINEDLQFVTEEGIVYEIDDNEKGNEAVEHVGKKMNLVGTITEDDGIKTITVLFFNLLEE